MNKKDRREERGTHVLAHTHMRAHTLTRTGRGKQRGDAEIEGAEWEMERQEIKKKEPAEQQAEDRLSSTTARWKENKPEQAALWQLGEY